MAKKLNAQATLLKLSVNGIISDQTTDTEIVELKWTQVNGSGSCLAFVVKPYVRKDLNFGTEVLDVELLQVQYPHIEPIPLKKYSCGDIEMILDQQMFQCIHPLKYFEIDRENTLIAVCLLLGGVLSGPRPSTSGLFSTYFKTLTQKEAD